jgi:hypothetical protein
MSIIESPHYRKLMRKETISLGDLYLKKIVMCEFKDGVNTDFNNFNQDKTAI